MKAIPFDLKDVKITGGPFRHALDLNHKYLLELDYNRLLARFREYAGLEPRALQYGGWENSTLSGHTLGHYLSACCMVSAAKEDAALKERVEQIIEELEICQNAHGDGYVSAIPRGRELFAEVAAGDIRTKGFDLNEGWAPLYTLHKLMAGLRDTYRILGIRKALTVETRLVEWLKQVFANLDESQMQDVLQCEFGGMNEVLADHYADTGDEDSLSLARRFYHKNVLDPLAQGRDCLPGKHGNTQFPKVIGLLKQYEYSKDDSLRKTAQFFWDTILHHHSYVTGGNSNGEYFGEPGQLNERLSLNTTETCNTYNMVKLTGLLFQWNASAEEADYCERALFNHILASQQPVDGSVCYFLPLAMGGYKHFQDKFNSFTCCVGTGMENHASYGGQIYFHNDENLYVNQFIPSSLTWKEKKVQVVQETNYPEDDTMVFRINGDAPTSFTLCIRYPYWAEKGIQVRINGETQPIKGHPGSFLQFSRIWQADDVVEVTIPMSLRLESMPDNPKRVAIMYGPLVLAGNLGSKEGAEIRDPMYVPVLIPDSGRIAEWLQPVVGASNTFRTVVGYPRNITLTPFYKMYQSRYSVYWDVFSSREWEEREPVYKEASNRLRKLEECTIDWAQLGEMQPERDHHFQGEGTYLASLNIRGCRYAVNGGWFSVDMKVDPNQHMLLLVTYPIQPETNCEFEVLLNDVAVAPSEKKIPESEQLCNVHYEIPGDVAGSGMVTVKFNAFTGKRTAKVYSLRTVNKENYLESIQLTPQK